MHLPRSQSLRAELEARRMSSDAPASSSEWYHDRPTVDHLRALPITVGCLSLLRTKCRNLLIILIACAPLALHMGCLMLVCSGDAIASTLALFTDLIHASWKVSKYIMNCQKSQIALQSQRDSPSSRPRHASPHQVRLLVCGQPVVHHAQGTKLQVRSATRR